MAHTQLTTEERTLLTQLESAFDLDAIDNDAALPVLAELHEMHHWPLPALAAYVQEQTGLVDEADELVYDQLTDYMEYADAA